MKKIVLKGEIRKLLGRKVKKLRLENKIPANVFGKKTKSMSVTVSQDEFKKVFSEAGETGLVDLTVDGKVHPVLVKNIQTHPVTDSVLHVDFYEVDLKEKVTANVPLKLVGDAPAVSNKIGVLLELTNELEVEALPTDLPEFIEVNLLALNNVGDTIKVSDLKIPNGVEVKTLAETEVVKVAELVSKEAEAQAKADEEAAAALAAAKPAEGEAAPQPQPAEKTAEATPKNAEVEAKKS